MSLLFVALLCLLVLAYLSVFVYLFVFGKCNYHYCHKNQCCIYSCATCCMRCMKPPNSVDKRNIAQFQLYFCTSQSRMQYIWCHAGRKTQHCKHMQ